MAYRTRMRVQGADKDSKEAIATKVIESPTVPDLGGVVGLGASGN